MSSSLSSMTAPPDADEDFDENTKSSVGNKKSIRKRLGLSKTSKSSKEKKSSNKHNNNSNEKRASSEKSIDVGDNNTTDNDVVENDDEGGRSSSMSALSASAPSIATGGSGKQRSSRGERRGSTGARAIGEGVMRRVRSLSRSRGSRHRSGGGAGGGDGTDTDNSSDNSSSSSEGGGSGRRKSTVVTVTSCRSDGYYNQKAPGSTSKLPRKAPTNLKLFHELAVGLKDAFTAVGQTPMKPIMEQEIEDEITGEKKTIVMDENEFIGRTVLWDFMGNIDFVRNK
jgi:hypothetical protein